MSEQIRTSDPEQTLRDLVARVEVLERTARFPTAPTKVLGYLESNATQTLGSGLTALTNLSPLTITVGPNRLIRATVFVSTLTVTGPGLPSLSIRMTVYGEIGFSNRSPASNGEYNVLMALGIVVAPAEGTYNVGAYGYSDITGTATFGDVNPGRKSYLIVEDIGPA